MKYKEIKALSLEEYTERLAVAEEDLKKLRLAHYLSPIENPTRIQRSRKLIAQLKTAQSVLKLKKASKKSC